VLGAEGPLAAGKLGTDPADREHRHGDECLWRSETERDPGEHPDLGVGRLDQRVRDARAKRLLDRRSVTTDLRAKGNEGGDLTPRDPRQPVCKKRYAFFALQVNSKAQLLLSAQVTP